MADGALSPAGSGAKAVWYARGMHQPLVSVLTPSFEQARWLADNLHSVACQTYPAIEHIVMDGGSTDGTRALLEAAGPRVHWTSEPDRGQAHALNKALALSQGDIIGWLNSDDAYFDSGVVAEVVGFFECHPEVDVVYGHAACVNADGRILHYFWAPPFRRRVLRLYDYIVQPAVFCRRSALSDRFVDESFEFAMDYELWLRLAQCHRFARIDRLIAIDRIQPERKSRTRLDALEIDSQRLAITYGAGAYGARAYGAGAHGAATFGAGAPGAAGRGPAASHVPTAPRASATQQVPEALRGRAVRRPAAGRGGSGALRLAGARRLAGAQRLAGARRLAAAHHIYCRVRGVRLVLGRHGEPAFSGDQDGRLAVLWRQIGRRRSTMPVSDL